MALVPRPEAGHNCIGHNYIGRDHRWCMALVLRPEADGEGSLHRHRHRAWDLIPGAVDRNTQPLPGMDVVPTLLHIYPSYIQAISKLHIRVHIGYM